MKGKDHITGIILAGGKSSRMGQDKALLSFKGKPFIEYAINALQPLASQIVIVSDHKEYDRFGVTRVDDLIKDAGPLAGLYSGLYHSKTENNLVLSCDVPLVDSQLLQQLITEDDPSVDVVQYKSGDKTMPLIALYKKSCIATCSTLLKSGERRLQELTKTLTTKTIILDKDLEHQVININTEHDLNHLRNEFDH